MGILAHNFFFTFNSKIPYLQMFLNCFVGEWAGTSVGTNFMPHVITVNAGEVRFDMGKR